LRGACIQQFLKIFVAKAIDYELSPFGVANPASYYNVFSIDSDPPVPGTILPANYREPVKWDNAASDLGPQSNTLGNLYFNCAARTNWRAGFRETGEGWQAEQG
jgi:hypothetical protein